GRRSIGFAKNKRTAYMKRSKTFATVLVSFALMVGVTSCAKVDIQADASDKRDVDARQVPRSGP
ncbi:unnamed protein product, partial [Mesorhabditis spiculigera]